MPPNNGSKFYNYKKYCSIVLMAVADSNYNFLSVDVGAYSSSADSQVFRNSAMRKKLLEGRLNMLGLYLKMVSLSLMY